MPADQLRRAPRWLMVAAVVVLLEVYAFVEGWRLQREHPEVKLGAGPFVGAWEWRMGVRMIPAALLAAVAVALLPDAARRLRPWICVGLTAAVAAGFALLLAASDGWSAVIRPVTDRTEYWAGVERSRPAGLYLRSFIERQQFYSVHVRGHPPGFMLLLKGMRHIGLGGPWAAAALSYVGIALTVAAVAFVVVRIAGPATMGRCLPFLALAPYAVWQGTSADALFCGVAAVGIALLSDSMTTTQPLRREAAAVAGGVVLALGAFLTYGMPTVFPIVAALAWRTRAWRWVAPAAIGALAVAGAFALGGFWWIDGLNSTRHWYRVGTAQFRPFWYFFFANIAVLLIAVGPAAAAGWARLRGFRPSTVVLGALFAAFVANASGLSKAETERIWLLYMPWLGVAAGALAVSITRARVWLAAQAIAAIVLQGSLVSKW